MRKYYLFLAGGVLAAIFLLAAIYLLRPITITDNSETKPIQAGGGPLLTVGQALAAAGVTLDPADRVTPDLNSLPPLDGKIQVQRAVQAAVWENGLVRMISGFARSPFALLKENNIQMGPGDRLAWNGQELDEGSVLPAGKPLVLQITRARTFILDNAGKRQAVTSSAATAAGALWEAAGVQLGPGDRLSIPAGSLPGENEIIAYQPARKLTIQTAGGALNTRSAAETVGQALAETGISLQGLDYAQPAEDQPLPADGQIRVVHVREEIRLKQTLLHYEKKTQPDANLELNARKVTQAGQYGVKVVRERARFEDGKEISRGFDSDWTASEPVAEVTGVGTKVVTKTLDTPEGKIEYYQAVQVYATSYSPCNQGVGHCSWSTSSGMRLNKGVIAVTLSWYRQLAGSRVYVPGYGFGVIGDVGGGIPGKNWIDLGFDEDSFKTGAFVGWTTMYLLLPAPASGALSLP